MSLDRDVPPKRVRKNTDEVPQTIAPDHTTIIDETGWEWLPNSLGRFPSWQQLWETLPIIYAKIKYKAKGLYPSNGLKKLALLKEKWELIFLLVTLLADPSRSQLTWMTIFILNMSHNIGVKGLSMCLIESALLKQGAVHLDNVPCLEIGHRLLSVTMQLEERQ